MYRNSVKTIVLGLVEQMTEPGWRMASDRLPELETIVIEGYSHHLLGIGIGSRTNIAPESAEEVLFQQLRDVQVDDDEF